MSLFDYFASDILMDFGINYDSSLMKTYATAACTLEPSDLIQKFSESANGRNMRLCYNHFRLLLYYSRQTITTQRNWLRRVPSSIGKLKILGVFLRQPDGSYEWDGDTGYTRNIGTMSFLK